jgi:hypothetical protein
MNFDLGHLLLAVIVVGLIATVGVMILKQRQQGVSPVLRSDPTWQTNPEGKLLEELERIHQQVLGAMTKAQALAARVPTYVSQLPVGTAYMPAPTLASLNDAYIDRDDLMKAIGDLGTAQAVFLDNVLVHNGSQPAVFYASKADTPNQNLTRVKA